MNNDSGVMTTTMMNTVMMMMPVTTAKRDDKCNQVENSKFFFQSNSSTKRTEKALRKIKSFRSVHPVASLEGESNHFMNARPYEIACSHDDASMIVIIF